MLEREREREGEKISPQGLDQVMLCYLDRRAIYPYSYMHAWSSLARCPQILIPLTRVHQDVFIVPTYGSRSASATYVHTSIYPYTYVYIVCAGSGS
jgi:hypothetical protein